MSDSKVENLHKEMSEMSLGDLCLLCGQAINMGFDEQRIDLMLKYLKIAIAKRDSDNCKNKEGKL